MMALRSTATAAGFLFVGLLFAPHACRAAAPPPAVVVAPVRVANVAPASTFIGRVQAIQLVAVTARVQGFVEKVNFQEGGLVKAGQVLFELEKAPFQAALEAAQGALDTALATQENAQLTYDRDSQLAPGRVISQSQLDTDTANLGIAKGNVLSARANLETAAINLSYTTVVSPIDGRIGRAAFTKGNLVGPTSGALATVVQVDPIRVVFSVADSSVVGALQKTGKTQAELNSSVVLALQLPNGKTYPQTGTVEFINNQVDPATGTVSVWGRFANPDGLLIPGGFVTVEVRRAIPQERPVVPVETVQNDKSGNFVLLVGKDNKVAQQKITLGRQIGQDWIVTAGLKGGEDVIVQGLQKVRAGEVVNPVQQSTLAPPSQQATAGALAAPGSGQAH
ncbi:MAG TPA: efflux RND transporter periplasmic adaptor subunit [Acetobacteraceae bacterium]|nr:efflux RND transporter periplasmic adaptor subunit [Acetobacteraceae bacterium]